MCYFTAEIAHLNSKRKRKASQAEALRGRVSRMADKSKSGGTRQYTQHDELQQAEKRGERLATGRTITRGGKSQGDVPGAAEQPSTKNPPEVVMPPVPPGESSPEAVGKTRAVADAMVELGENA